MELNLRPKQQARMGMFHLEEAVLDVLLEARVAEKIFGLEAIQHRLGIVDIEIVQAVVHGLQEVGRVKGREDIALKFAWTLTDSEYLSRRDVRREIP